MNADPALALLAGTPAGEGERALLLNCAAAPNLIAEHAARYGETLCQEDWQPRAAGLAASETVRILLGDIPCCLARPEGPAEDFLSPFAYPEGHFDRIVLRLGRGTAQADAALIESFRLLREGGELVAAAANREGIKSFAKRAEAHFGNGNLAALKHGCRLFRYRKQASLPAAPAEDPAYFHSLRHILRHAAGEVPYRTKPGIFAYRATDPGTALLARHLPDCSGRRVLDLCCGSGALALAAFARGAAEVLAVDASATAVACAQRNFSEAGFPGATLCSDLAGVPAGGYDLAIANPPFHAEGAADYSLPVRVSEALASALGPGGEALVVANRFLDYAGAARSRFASAATIADADGYRIHRMVMAR